MRLSDDSRRFRNITIEADEPVRAPGLGGVLRSLGYRGRSLSFFLRGKPRASLALLILLCFVTIMGAVWAVWPSRASTRAIGLPVPEQAIDSHVASRAIDGDTLEMGNGRRVRIIGIDAPERGKPLGNAATETLADLVAGKSLRLEYDGPRSDRYGRVLAHVWVGTVLVSEVMVRKGLATVALFASSIGHSDRLLSAQEAARAARIGIWAQLDQPASATSASPQG
jgi:endonuclease YncB( thermonuclease family)